MYDEVPNFSCFANFRLRRLCFASRTILHRPNLRQVFLAKVCFAEERDFHLLRFLFSFIVFFCAFVIGLFLIAGKFLPILHLFFSKTYRFGVLFAGKSVGELEVRAEIFFRILIQSLI